MRANAEARREHTDAGTVLVSASAFRCAGSRIRSAHIPGAVALALLAAAGQADAQEWRARVTSRIQYAQVRPLVLDSAARSEVTDTGGVTRATDGVRVRCPPGGDFCFFYPPADREATAPLTTDFEATAWGFGVQGLRLHVNGRLRTALTNANLWPQAEDNFDLIAAYVELHRTGMRLRAGRQVAPSGLGFYGYDGASAEVRLAPWRLTLDAYAGWGLARGVPEPVNSDEFGFLEEFRPDDRAYLLGAGAFVRPVSGSRVSALYQREIETDRSGIVSERAAFDAAYGTDRIVLRANADYDLATGAWGKASFLAGGRVAGPLYLEAQLFRYRPLFSLQTIWAVFSPVPYRGAAVRARATLRPGLWLAAGVERRQYSETEAEVPLGELTDRAWRFSVDGGWSPVRDVSVSGCYWLTYGAGAALSSGEVRVAATPARNVQVAVSGSAFQQLYEFRIGEGRVYSAGMDVTVRAGPGRELWGSLLRYHHDRRGDSASAVDWDQWRGDLGFSLYLGREPGLRRARYY